MYDVFSTMYTVTSTFRNCIKDGMSPILSIKDGKEIKRKKILKIFNAFW